MLHKHFFLLSIIYHITMMKRIYTFVESSNILVCSAINRTQKHDLCISGGQRECENAGFLRTGLLMSPSPETVRSSDSDCGMVTGP